MKLTPDALNGKTTILDGTAIRQSAEGKLIENNTARIGGETRAELGPVMQSPVPALDSLPCSEWTPPMIKMFAAKVYATRIIPSVQKRAEAEAALLEKCKIPNRIVLELLLAKAKLSSRAPITDAPVPVAPSPVIATPAAPPAASSAPETTSSPAATKPKSPTSSRKYNGSPKSNDEPDEQKKLARGGRKPKPKDDLFEEEEFGREHFILNKDKDGDAPSIDYLLGFMKEDDEDGDSEDDEDMPIRVVGRPPKQKDAPAATLLKKDLWIAPVRAQKDEPGMFTEKEFYDRAFQGLDADKGRGQLAGLIENDPALQDILHYISTIGDEKIKEDKQEEPEALRAEFVKELCALMRSYRIVKMDMYKHTSQDKKYAEAKHDWELLKTFEEFLLDIPLGLQVLKGKDKPHSSAINAKLKTLHALVSPENVRLLKKLIEPIGNADRALDELRDMVFRKEKPGRFFRSSIENWSGLPQEIKDACFVALRTEHLTFDPNKGKFIEHMKNMIFDAAAKKFAAGKRTAKE